MSKLKPQLIVTGSNKKKSSFAGGIGYFLLLAVVFVLGVYVGMRLDNSDLDENMLSRDLQSNVPQGQSVSGESHRTAADLTQEKESNTSVQDELPQSASESNSDKIEDANLIVDPIDQTTELVDNTLTPSSLNTVEVAEENESTLAEGDLAADLSLGDSYRLQVAAFGNIDDANDIVSNLKLKGYDAYIVTTPNSRGEVWNLIKVGNFKTAQEAWNFSTMYQDKEGGEVFVESISRGRVYREQPEENNMQQQQFQTE